MVNSIKLEIDSDTIHKECENKDYELDYGLTNIDYFFKSLKH